MCYYRCLPQCPAEVSCPPSSRSPHHWICTSRWCGRLLHERCSVQSMHSHHDESTPHWAHTYTSLLNLEVEEEEKNQAMLINTVSCSLSQIPKLHTLMSEKYAVSPINFFPINTCIQHLMYQKWQILQLSISNKYCSFQLSIHQRTLEKLIMVSRKKY